MIIILFFTGKEYNIVYSIEIVKGGNKDDKSCPENNKVSHRGVILQNL
jgi:hypothetical protein